jgi:hypothetical protein
MKILDLSAGKRAVWYNKNHPLAIYLDRRAEVNPTIVCDTNEIPAQVGTGFNLICWDPPHMNCGPNSDMSKRYGYHTTEQIVQLLKRTGREAHRISAPNALMALKWNTHDIKLSLVFKLLPSWEPLFGHLTKDGARSQTYWIMLRRLGFPPIPDPA